MPARSTKRRFLLAGGVVLLMLVALLLLEKRGLAPSWFHLEKISQQTWARIRGTGRPAEPERSQKAIRAAADRWYEEILSRHPELAVTYKDVPDDENGFLQWLDFIDRCKANGALDLPEDIDKMLKTPEAWDSKRMAEWLSQHQELIEEITKLGLLPDQSVKGIDFGRYSWVEPRLLVSANRLLLASAKLSMEQGDQDSALRHLRATMGSANHFDGIETPTLLNETVSALLRGSSRRFAIEALSSGVALSPENLKQWQQTLQSGGSEREDLAHVFFGEWHQSTRGLLLPLLIAPNHSDQDSPDPDAVIEAHISFLKAWSEQIGSSDLKRLSTNDLAPSPSNALPDSEALATGTNAWVHGWSRGRIEAIQVQAAFATALGEEIPIEPISGKPFLFDPGTGTINMPEDPAERFRAETDEGPVARQISRIPKS